VTESAAAPRQISGSEAPRNEAPARAESKGKGEGGREEGGREGGRGAMLGRRAESLIAKRNSTDAVRRKGERGEGEKGAGDRN